MNFYKKILINAVLEALKENSIYGIKKVMNLIDIFYDRDLISKKEVQDLSELCDSSLGGIDIYAGETKQETADLDSRGI